MFSYPVAKKADQIKSAVEKSNSLILEAEPGAGKTTIVPLLLYREGWLEGKKIIMLEPRRLAAKNAARRMSSLLNESAGKTVGYRVRGEHKIGPGTRIEVVTEGILTRMLQSDPELRDTACLIFDEFHERSIHADTGLAFALDVQRNLRDDLRIIVMSATLDTAGLSHIMPHAPLITIEGRNFPVDICYAGNPFARERLVRQSRNPLADAVLDECVRTEWSNTLVFLQGRRDIEDCFALLCEKKPEHVDVYKLYGDLSLKEQQKAIEACKEGRKKIVLSTNIAETSITIEGIDTVIDSGFEKKVHYSPEKGVDVMESTRISNSSATQRAGRAGRTEAGRCIRLWNTKEQLIDHNEAEIMVCDLSNLVLSLSAWGVSSSHELSFIQHPSEGRVRQASALLKKLKALDPDDRISQEGRIIEGLGMHPRFGHMLLQSRSRGRLHDGLELAVLLNSGYKGPLRDIRQQLSFMRNSRPFQNDFESLKRRIDAAPSAAWGQTDNPETGSCSFARLLSLAYPDRMAKQLSPGRFKLSNGMEVLIDTNDDLSKSDFLVVADVKTVHGKNYIQSAVPVSKNEFFDDFSDQIETRACVELKGNRFQAIEERCIGKIILNQKPAINSDSASFTNAVLAYFSDSENMSQRITEDKKLSLFYKKLTYWCNSFSDTADVPDISISSLCLNVHDWLKPFLSAFSPGDSLNSIPLHDALVNYIGYDLFNSIVKELPDSFEVPSGSKIRLEYKDDEVILKARIQELFGLQNSPVFAGKPLSVHLLSPAMRPIQITRDIKSFWDTTYAEVKKELKGRYPKHYWPDNPYEAQAIRGVRPKR